MYGAGEVRLDVRNHPKLALSLSELFQPFSGIAHDAVLTRVCISVVFLAVPPSTTRAQRFCALLRGTLYRHSCRSLLQLHLSLSPLPQPAPPRNYSLVPRPSSGPVEVSPSLHRLPSLAYQFHVAPCILISVGTPWLSSANFLTGVTSLADIGLFGSP